MLSTKMSFTKISYIGLKDWFIFRSFHSTRNLCNRIHIYSDGKLLSYSKISAIHVTANRRLHLEIANHNISRHNVCTADNILRAKVQRQILKQKIKPILAGGLIDINNHVRQYSSAINVDPEMLVTPEHSTFITFLSECKPVQLVQESIISVHSYTGLPWWAMVILTTIALRVVVLSPLTVYQHHNTAKLSNLKYEMDDVVRQLKMEANYAVSQSHYSQAVARQVYQQNLRKEWNKLVVKENCHPMKSYVVVWLQLPFWLTISAVLRNLCYMMPKCDATAYSIFEELSTGGFGWIVNLVQPDTLWILPLSLGFLNLLNIEIHRTMETKKLTTVKQYSLYFFRGLAIVMVPIAACVPSCMCLYWVTNSTFTVLQNLALLSPKFRRSVGIPETEFERENPYSYLYEQTKKRLLRKNAVMHIKS